MIWVTYVVGCIAIGAVLEFWASRIWAHYQCHALERRFMELTHGTGRIPSISESTSAAEERDE